MFNLDIKARGKKDKKSILTMRGKLTVENAQRIAEALSKVLSDERDLAINLEQIEEVDLTCLQLLIAAHRSFKARNRKIIISGSIPEAFTRAVEEYGFCGRSDENCFWIEASRKG